MTTLDFSVLSLVDRLRMAASVILGLQVEVGDSRTMYDYSEYAEDADFVEIPREEMN